MAAKRRRRSGRGAGTLDLLEQLSADLACGEQARVHIDVNTASLDGRNALGELAGQALMPPAV